ncbi:hypothetical protein HID58_013199 [Brassica napus]|uniref:Uncharacterized protein n=3 Tax=Brassica TaxID=3705 RepID=A0ABQ8E3W2_BRANA|nr:hypothetical protein HID58_013199 [Brassica napus]
MEDKLDEEIASLEKPDADDLEVLRERRLQQMKRMAEKRKRWRSHRHGEYTEIPSEKDFFAAVKASEPHDMSILAKQHIETRFVKIQAEKSPFLAERLTIVAGFNELGGKDDFSTDDLEDRLARAQVIHYEGESSSHKVKSMTQARRSVRQSANSDSDSE